jgi:hypothetical protein
MRTIKAATCCLVLLLAACSSKSVWTEGPFEAVKSKAAEENKLILVDFYSPG